MPDSAGFPDCAEPAAPGGDMAAQIAQLKSELACVQGQVAYLRAPVRQKFDEAQIARYGMNSSLMEYRVDLYHWQHYASNFMMYTAAAVVWVGLALSAAQLIHAMRIGQRDDGTLEANVTGLKITSSVTGLLILGMSLGFIYLFLHEVYVVHPPPADALGTPMVAAAAKPPGEAGPPPP